MVSTNYLPPHTHTADPQHTPQREPLITCKTLPGTHLLLEVIPGLPHFRSFYLKFPYCCRNTGCTPSWFCRGEKDRSHGLAVSLGDILSPWSDKVNFKHYRANIQILCPTQPHTLRYHFALGQNVKWAKLLLLLMAVPLLHLMRQTSGLL